jgi:hypothetical protein
MSDVRFYNDGKPIDNGEKSEEEFNHLDNPVQLDNMISQQEYTPPVNLDGKADDQIVELDDTINNKIPENVSPTMNEEVDELDDTINNNIPEYISTSMSKELIRDVPNEPSIEPEASFFDREESENFNQQWMEIQGKFVDEPRIAVQKADDLISDMIKQITTMFDKELDTLETQWNQGDEVSTEDLRMTFQHYRSFFHRLLD